MMSRMFNIARSEGDPRVISSGRSSLRAEDRMARHLGWLSIGLGVVELFGARRMARALGMRDREDLIRGFGAREIASGVMTLSSEKHVGLWGRVVGDVLDLAVLSRGLSRRNPKRANVELAIGVVAGVALLDFVTATLVGRRHARGRTDVRYDDRSGFPRGLAGTRQAIRREGETPLVAPSRVGAAQT